jgi:hypothetical protein
MRFVTLRAVLLASSTLLPAGAFAMTAEEIESAVTRLGGKVQYDDALPGRPLVRIDLSKTTIRDEDLAFLSQVPGLRELDIRQTTVGDAALEHVAQLGKLRFLNVFRTGMTDKGLERIQDLRELETLLMGGTRVTDAGMTYLKAFPRLRKVSIFDTGVGDKGVRHLRGSKHLEVLLIGKSKVSEKGAKALQDAIPGLQFREQTTRSLHLERHVGHFAAAFDVSDERIAGLEPVDRGA